MAAGAAPPPEGPTGAADELPIDVELIKVLAADSRRDILRLLGTRRYTLTEMSDALGLKKATVLEHLQKLVAAGLIQRLDEDERLWVYYELTPRGKRLVKPERTRFFLILAGTAVAAVLVGAIVTAAVLLHATPAAPHAESGGTSALSPEPHATVPPVVWRGLDDQATIGLPSAPLNASLALRAADGSERAIPIHGANATLTASDIDALPAGRYTLAISGAAGESPLPDALVVQDPEIAIAPRVLPASGGAVEIALTPPTLPAPSSVVVNGETFTDRAAVTTSLGPSGDLRVGRLFETKLTVLPDVSVAYARADANLSVKVASSNGSLADAEVLLDGASLGRTNATGDLVAPWPAPGEHALRVVGPGGATVDRDVQATNDSIADLAPRLALDAVDARVPPSTGMRIRVEVRNDGATDELATLTARENGALLASALVEVPAHGRAQALLESPLASPSVVDVSAFAARTSLSVHTINGGTTAARTTSSAPAPSPPAAAAPAADTSSGQTFAMSSAAPADATQTVYLAPMTPSPVAASGAPASTAAKTPGLEPAIMIGVALVLSILARRRR